MDLIGDAFLSCGCLSYYGPFTGGYRDDLVATWMKRVKQEGIPCSAGGDGDDETGDGGGGGGVGGFSLIGTLGDPVEIRGWQNCALPTDKVIAECQGNEYRHFVELPWDLYTLLSTPRWRPRCSWPYPQPKRKNDRLPFLVEYETRKDRPPRYGLVMVTGGVPRLGGSIYRGMLRCSIPPPAPPTCFRLVSALQGLVGLWSGEKVDTEFACAASKNKQNGRHCFSHLRCPRTRPF